MKVRPKIFVPAVILFVGVIFVSYYLFLRKTGQEARRTDIISSDTTSSDDTTGLYEINHYTYKIMNIYPHDPGAFTQGLAFEDGILYEGTGGMGVSTLRKVALETGKVLQQKRLRGHYFGEGITIYKDKVIQITYLSKTGFVYSKENFEILSRFNYPNEGWGLTYDGTHLIMSDGTSTLHLLDPETFERKGHIEVYDTKGPVPFLNELEFVRGSIYANIWQSDDIAIISPQTGRVIGYIQLQGLLPQSSAQEPVDVLNGIAYDIENGRLFVTGKLWPELFEIELVPLK